MGYEILEMEPGDRMVRLGLGQNKGRWFFRIDLWKYGLRLTIE